MEKITQFAVNNSRATLLFLACILIVGIQTFLSMPSQEDPEITIHNAQVTAFFPGMPTDKVENLLAKPLEKSIKEIPVEEIRTTISTGKVILQPKVADQYFELDPIWQDLRNKMNDMRASLPEARGPIVNDDFGRVAAATIAADLASQCENCVKWPTICKIKSARCQASARWASWGYKMSAYI